MAAQVDVSCVCISLLCAMLGHVSPDLAPRIDKKTHGAAPKACNGMRWRQSQLAATLQESTKRLRTEHRISRSSSASSIMDFFRPDRAALELERLHSSRPFAERYHELLQLLRSPILDVNSARDAAQLAGMLDEPDSPERQPGSAAAQLMAR